MNSSIDISRRSEDKVALSAYRCRVQVCDRQCRINIKRNKIVCPSVFIGFKVVTIEASIQSEEGLWGGTQGIFFASNLVRCIFLCFLSFVGLLGVDCIGVLVLIVCCICRRFLLVAGYKMTVVEY
jgi:hypothetical protein